ncbi:MAG: HAMP domain-containing histidine kinase [Clostridia bacterium]|nr:HAMP domain-containing histidine kinase [Clostridia bacterium]
MKQENEQPARRRHGDTRLKKTNIRLRYFSTVSLCVITGLLILGLSIMIFVSRNWENVRLEKMSENCSMVVRSIIASGASEGDGADYTTDPELFSLLTLTLRSLSESTESDVVIFAPDGSFAFCCHMNSDEGILPGVCPVHGGMQLSQEAIAWSDAAFPSPAKETFDLFGLLGSDCFVSAYSVFSDGERAAVIVSSQDVGIGLRPYLQNFLKMLLISAGIALVLSAVVTYVSTSRMVRPLRQMASAAKKYATGDFSYRIEDDSDLIELYELKKAINLMAENLEVIEKSRSSFVANVSHELKTPMTTIGGFIDGMLDGTIDREDYPKYLNIVSSEVKRLSHLVVSMLNMSKIEAGQLTISPTRFDIVENTVRTLIGFEKFIDEKHLEITGLGSSEEFVIEADPSLMNQVIYNLIDNAIKFTPPGGVISFRAGYDPDGAAVFAVRNTGDGIPADDLEIIFDRFYKVDKSRGLDAKSFGLGLYIVKTIVELHSGSIRAESEQGKYTEFIITMPVSATRAG